MSSGRKMLLVVLFIWIMCVGNCAYSYPNSSDHLRRTLEKKHDGHTSRKTLVVPIMLHVDKSLRRKLAKDKVQVGRTLRKYAARLLADVQMNFVGLTENYEIILKLLKARSLKSSNYTKMVGDASVYLRNYCEWQAHLKWTKNMWHYSVLLTGLDIYYLNTKGKKVTASTGRTYTNGMCSLTKSCSVVEWHPDRAAHLLTHEIAHSLGVNHDGPPKNACKPEDRSIMIPKYRRSWRPKAWSACNKRDFKRYITSRKSKCLFCEENRKLTNKRYH